MHQQYTGTVKLSINTINTTEEKNRDEEVTYRDKEEKRDSYKTIEEIIEILDDIIKRVVGEKEGGEGYLDRLLECQGISTRTRTLPEPTPEDSLEDQGTMGALIPRGRAFGEEGSRHEDELRGD